MQVQGGAGDQDVVLEMNPDLIGDTCAIHLGQEAGDTAVWKVKVYVHFPEGQFMLGTFTTSSPAAGDPPARVVGFGVCPGATGWHVSLSSVTVGALADCIISSSKCCSGTPGVFSNSGSFK